MQLLFSPSTGFTCSYASELWYFCSEDWRCPYELSIKYCNLIVTCAFFNGNWVFNFLVECCCDVGFWWSLGLNCWFGALLWVAGSSTVLWVWALYYVPFLSLVALQLKLLMAFAYALYPAQMSFYLYLLSLLWLRNYQWLFLIC